MLFSRCAHKGRSFFGLVEGDLLREISGTPFEPGNTLREHSIADLEFLPPLIPSTFYAAGFNYEAHLNDHEYLGYTPVKLSEHPEVGYRANSALTGHLQPIVKPADIEGRFEAEGELVAVIGTTLRHASYDQARDGIFGWTIGNDVSAREWQHADRTFWRSKNSDTFKPMGPWIATGIDPLESTTTVSLNGVVASSFATGAMIFDPYDFIMEITKYITMSRGDVLWMGAQGAHQLDVGDTVDVSISALGTLTNTVATDEHRLPGTQKEGHR